MTERREHGGFWRWLFTNTAPEQRAESIKIPSREATPSGVTSDEALGLTAVYRAVAIRAAALKQMSIDVYRGEQVIDRPAIIRQPDTDVEYGPFIEMTANALSLTGNAFWRIRRDSAGSVRSLEALNPHDVTIRQSKSDRVIGYTHNGHDLGLADVRHLSKLRVPGSPRGLGPIQAARAELRTAIAVRDYARDALGDSVIPGGILSFGTPITDAQAAAAHERLDETQGGRRGTLVLGGGAEYKPVLLSPQDAQWVQSQQWSTTTVARLFGVPSSLMLVSLEGNSLTYSNVAQEWLAFVKFGLTDDLLEIEDAFSAILPRGQRAKFNVSALLRMDDATRHSMHNADIKGGWLTPNEVRAIEGLDPLPGGDTLQQPPQSHEKRMP